MSKKIIIKKLFVILMLGNAFLSFSMSSQLDNDIHFTMQRHGAKPTLNEPNIKFDNLLVLGIGGKNGFNYKINIFRKIKPYTNNLYVCDLKDNDRVLNLLDNGFADSFLPVTSLNLEIACEELIEQPHSRLTVFQLRLRLINCSL